MIYDWRSQTFVSALCWHVRHFNLSTTSNIIMYAWNLFSFNNFHYIFWKKNIYFSCLFFNLFFKCLTLYSHLIFLFIFIYVFGFNRCCCCWQRWWWSQWSLLFIIIIIINDGQCYIWLVILVLANVVCCVMYVDRNKTDKAVYICRHL